MGRIDLVAIDGSPHSRYAFEWYLENMYREGDSVVLTYVVEYCISVGIPGIATDVEAICAAVKKKNDEVGVLTDEYTRILRSRQVPFKVVTLTGDKPGEVIVKVATDEKANSIILGTRGLGVLRRTLLGSVSEYVVNHANCPVTVVRRSE